MGTLQVLGSAFQYGEKDYCSEGQCEVPVSEASGKMVIVSVAVCSLPEETGNTPV